MGFTEVTTQESKMMTVTITRVFRHDYDDDNDRDPYVSGDFSFIREDGRGMRCVGESIHRKILEILMEEQGVTVALNSKDEYYYVLEPPVVYTIPEEVYFQDDESYLYKKYFPDYSATMEGHLNEMVECLVKFENPTSNILSSDRGRFNREIYENPGELIARLKDRGFLLEKQSVELFARRVKGPNHYMRLTEKATGKSQLMHVGPYSSGISFEQSREDWEREQEQKKLEEEQKRKEGMN